MEKKMMTFAGLVIMVVVLNACPAIGGCDAELVKLLPCATFVMGPAVGKAPPECCEGVKNVLHGADTNEKRRSLCQCLKDTAVGAEVKITPEKLKNVTDPCGVEVPIPGIISFDCNTIPVFERDQIELGEEY
ncbi:non-specific lipid-transfer protein 1-like [Rosa rugosa]|uniref:non-specific lipid-transfer protein 1-like n=1 Tax=Rosa rugosa TaxID=74645 RepID=UPI002B40FC6A|nr:non-specific lipid-transfer protein 1-like [Rosa rugosa]